MSSKPFCPDTTRSVSQRHSAQAVGEVAESNARHYILALDFEPALRVVAEMRRCRPQNDKPCRSNTTHSATRNPAIASSLAAFENIAPTASPTAPLVTLLAILLLSAAFFSPNMAFAAQDDISIAELSNAGEHLDHQHVVFDAEVVGDVINNGDDSYWVTLNDGTGSISVAINQASRDSITTLGNYGQRGTELEVRGEFNLACDDHDGLSDVHAFSTKVIYAGSTIEHPINAVMLVIGAILIFLGLGLVALYSSLRKRRI